MIGGLTRNIIFITLILFLSATKFAYAFSCDDDLGQMRSQIARYSIIKSVDGKSINLLVKTGENKQNCFAHALFCPGGRNNCHHHCIIQWQKGNWVNTLACPK